jgi:thioredoxin 1
MKIVEWNRKIKQTRRPFVAEFWAPWCGPCKMMEPRLKKMAEQYAGKVELVRINADQSQELLRSLRIMGIPTMIAMADGQELFRRVGLQNEAALEEIFVATQQARKPEFHLSERDRIFRGLLGAIIIAVGIILGINYWVMALGGVVMFTAVYDRCPIYKAVSARIKEFFQPAKTQQSRNSVK